MKHRYPNILGNSVLVDRLISESVNVLSVIYGQVYFPTYSNGLKENAHYLGFRWTDINPSGVNALVLRYDWELSKDIDRKTSTIRYNGKTARH